MSVPAKWASPPTPLRAGQVENGPTPRTTSKGGGVVVLEAHATPPVRHLVQFRQ